MGPAVARPGWRGPLPVLEFRRGRRAHRAPHCSPPLSTWCPFPLPRPCPPSTGRRLAGPRRVAWNKVTPGARLFCSPTTRFPELASLPRLADFSYRRRDRPLSPQTTLLRAPPGPTPGHPAGVLAAPPLCLDRLPAPGWRTNSVTLAAAERPPPRAGPAPPGLAAARPAPPGRSTILSLLSSGTPTPWAGPSLRGASLACLVGQPLKGGRAHDHRPKSFWLKGRCWRGIPRRQRRTWPQIPQVSEVPLYR